MKLQINQQALAQSRALFALCLTGGQLDEEKTRSVIQVLKRKKLRNLRGLLTGLLKRAEHHLHERAISIESAAALSASETDAAFTLIEGRFGASRWKRHAIQPKLIGGMRIQIGSNVWDDSIAGRLKKLQDTIR